MFNPTQPIYSGINLNHSNLSLRTHSYCSKNTLTLIAVIFAVGALIALTIGGLILSPSEIGIVAFIAGGVTGGLSILFFIMAVKKHLDERRHQNHPPERNNPLLQSEIEAPANQQPPPQSTDELHPPVSSRTDPQLSPTNSPQRSDPLHGRDISTLSLNEIESLLSDIESLSPEQVQALAERQGLLEDERLARRPETPLLSQERLNPIRREAPLEQERLTLTGRVLNFNGTPLDELTSSRIESILAAHLDTLSEPIIERLLARQEFLENSMRERTRQNAPQATQIDRQNEFGTEPIIIEERQELIEDENRARRTEAPLREETVVPVRREDPVGRTETPLREETVVPVRREDPVGRTETPLREEEVNQTEFIYFNQTPLNELTSSQIESILSDPNLTLSEPIINELLSRHEMLKSRMNPRARQNSQPPTPIRPFVNPLSAISPPVPTNPSATPSNPISENRQENIDEQYGTEEFNIEVGLFESLPENLIHRLLMREDARQRLIQLRKNQPSLYTVEPLPAYDPQYVQEYWENYEFYSTKTFRWEPLQVRNRFSPIHSKSLESVGYLGNSSYLDIFILDFNRWYTPEEFESIDPSEFSQRSHEMIDKRRNRRYVRKKNPESQQASVSVPSTPPTPSPILSNDSEVVQAAIRQENQVPQAQGSPSDGIDQVNETPNDLYVENTSYFKCHWERYQISYDNGNTWENLKVLNEESGIELEEIEQYENQEDGSVDIYVLNEYWFNNDEIALLLSTKTNPFTNETFPPHTLDLLENRTFPLVRKLN